MSATPLPTFVIIGAQKSATRWLRINLGEHPDVFTAPSEVHFWNNGHRVKHLGLDWYREQFAAANGEQIIGEATPGYMIWRHHPPEVARRISEGLPEARLIAILRNPIDRANSAMLHHIRRSRIPRDSRLVNVVREHTTPPQKDRFCLVSGGWYAASLAPYVEHFGDQLLVVLHDDVLEDPATVYRRVLAHVGAAVGYVPPDIARVRFSNRRGTPAPRYELTPEDRVELWEYFHEDVTRLEEMLGLDLSRWRPDGADHPQHDPVA